MAVAEAESNSDVEESTCRCNCYVVANLTKSILGTGEISSLKDRYVLGEQLGCGQFGIIRECTDKLTGDVLACKSIAKEKLTTKEDVLSIKLEIEIMTKLSGHPNIVGLKAVYEEEEYVHLVMELCEGGELFIQLENHGKFSEVEARVLFRQLMQVVMYCHDNGIIHRDLKPENILLTTKASSSPIKLADFGLATYIRPGENLYGTVGSPFYIAPEVLAGGYNEAADVWSAGVVLYILLSGVPPFWGKTKSRIFDAVRAADLRFPTDPWDSISHSASQLIQGMLSTDPCKRLTAKQVLDHSWLKETVSLNKEPCEFRNQSGEGMDLEKVSYSLMPRNKDISFNTEMPLFGDYCSPAATCRSSFTTSHVDSSTPSYVSSVFSFQNDQESNTLEFSPRIVSMPSFSFFSPDCVVEQGICLIDLSVNTRKVDLNLSRLPSELEQKAVDEKKGGLSGLRMMGIQSKRNRTIGHGELELMATESVIRWASCTHLSTATTLRPSLVC